MDIFSLPWESIITSKPTIASVIVLSFLGYLRKEIIKQTEINNKIQQLEKANSSLEQKVKDVNDNIERIKNPGDFIESRAVEFATKLENERQKINQSIVDINREIDKSRTIIKKTTGEIYFFEREVIQADSDFQRLSLELEKLLSKHNDFVIANDFLDSLSKYTPDMSFYNRLESLEQKIKDDYLNNNQKLIKIDRWTFKESDFQKIEGANDNQREASKRIYFDYKYKLPPKVFVAIAKIDTATELYSRETGAIVNPIAYAKSLQSRYIRLEANIKHKNHNGFTVVAMTWNDSIVFSVDLVWIVFGS